MSLRLNELDLKKRVFQTSVKFAGYKVELFLLIRENYFAKFFVDFAYYPYNDLQNTIENTSKNARKTIHNFVAKFGVSYFGSKYICIIGLVSIVLYLSPLNHQLFSCLDSFKSSTIIKNVLLL